MRTSLLFAAALSSVLAFVGAAGAADPAPPAPPAAPSATPSSPPPPYSLPWQLRPAMPVSVVRSDTTIATYNKPGATPDAAPEGTFAVASMLLASYKVTPDFAPFLRLGVVGNPDGAAVTNLATGATLGIPVGSNMRAALFMGLALPIGSGSGDTPDPKVLGTERAGILARSAMDNAMFAVNDLVVFPGLDIAYVANKLTVQVEATMLALYRVQGEKAQKDSSKTNLTVGVHVGYFFMPWLSAGVELRYQRWLSLPAAVAADATGDSRDNVTFALGPRFHIPVGKRVWLRPGVAYARGLDLPMSKSEYNIIQVDLPVVY